MKRWLVVVALAACWTESAPPPSSPTPHPMTSTHTSTPAAAEHTVVVRIDPTPAAKRFQGVWLEHPDGKRWLIDYRARDMWQAFANHEVRVTGECYAFDDHVQSVGAQHFRVHRMRLAGTPKTAAPFVELGPEITLDGSFENRAWPAGSKLAGSSQRVFRETSGKEYVIADPPIMPATGPSWSGKRTIRARVAVPDPAYSSTSSGDHVFVVSVHDQHHPVPGDGGTTPTRCP